MKVGRVLGNRFGDDGRRRVARLRRGRLRAARARGDGVLARRRAAADKGAGGLDVDFPSFAALATGAVAFDTPTVLGGPGRGGRALRALGQPARDRRPPRPGRGLAYSLVFPNPVGDLGQGAPVTLAGKTGRPRRRHQAGGRAGRQRADHARHDRPRRPAAGHRRPRHDRFSRRAARAVDTIIAAGLGRHAGAGGRGRHRLRREVGRAGHAEGRGAGQMARPASTR